MGEPRFNSAMLYRVWVGAGAVMGILAMAILDTASSVRAAAPPAPTSSSTPEPDTVKLTDSQLSSIKTAVVENHEFRVVQEAVGSIDFNQDRSVQVYSPYQGRIIETSLNLGDPVKKGQVLFTIESPDFIAAQSNLITAAATLEQTESALRRAKELYENKDIDQNDYETAVANEASAEGTLRAARNAVTVFGKTSVEIKRIEVTRRVETALVVRSPLTGTVTARNAAPGLLEQPGNPPAPYAVADLSTVWMLAQVPESASPLLKRGQTVEVAVSAFPGRIFAGRVNAVGASVDPNSHRVMVRSEIKNPTHELLPQMFATFVIRTGEPSRSPAIPENGVVREGDGTMSVWVVGSDPHKFFRRSVRIGHEEAGYDEILDGVQSGENVAVDGAIFLSNMLYGGAT